MGSEAKRPMLFNPNSDLTFTYIYTYFFVQQREIDYNCEWAPHCESRFYPTSRCRGWRAQIPRNGATGNAKLLSLLPRHEWLFLWGGGREEEARVEAMAVAVVLVMAAAFAICI